MRMTTIVTFALALFVIAGSGCGIDRSHSSLLAPATSPGFPVAGPTGLVTIPFDTGHFVANVTNPYLPLTPGTVFSYRTKGTVETNRVEVTRDTKSILGVRATVVHDQVFQSGVLSEDTFDWYAQDDQGNVWYLGEDTKEIENGVVVSTEGSWQAGVNGAKAGVIMLAQPKIGDSYKQEDAPGVVADMGKVMSFKETAVVPAGTFTPCLQTAEWTPIEPGVREAKFYYPGIGNVLETSSRQGGERVELVSVTKK